MSSKSRPTEFWTETERYHDLAREYERHVETDHPDRVTSRGMCVCLDYFSWCGWASTSVEYPEYNGPDVHSLSRKD